MRIYVLTDEITEEIVTVFTSKNDNTAIKTIERDLSKSGQLVEVNLYALDVTIDYLDKFKAFYDTDYDYEKPMERLIYSFPKTKIEAKQKVLTDIMKDSQSEEE